MVEVIQFQAAHPHQTQLEMYPFSKKTLSDEELTILRSLLTPNIATINPYEVLEKRLNVQAAVLINFAVFVSGFLGANLVRHINDAPYINLWVTLYCITISFTVANLAVLGLENSQRERITLEAFRENILDIDKVRNNIGPLAHVILNFMLDKKDDSTRVYWLINTFNKIVNNCF